MFTRTDYMDGKCTHNQFYAQFVTSDVREAVKYHIGIESIMSSKNEHFNDISLAVWDSFDIKGVVDQAAIREAYGYAKGSFSVEQINASMHFEGSCTSDQTIG